MYNLCRILLPLEGVNVTANDDDICSTAVVEHLDNAVHFLNTVCHPREIGIGDGILNFVTGNHFLTGNCLGTARHDRTEHIGDDTLPSVKGVQKELVVVLDGLDCGNFITVLVHVCNLSHAGVLPCLVAVGDSVLSDDVVGVVT